VDKHCFLPLLHAYLIKCCVLLHFPLPNYPYCCSLHSPMCMFHLLICALLKSSPIACPPSSVLHWCLLCIWFNVCVSVILLYLFIISFGRIGWIGHMNTLSNMLHLVQFFRWFSVICYLWLLLLLHAFLQIFRPAFYIHNFILANKKKNTRWVTSIIYSPSVFPLRFL